MLKEIITLDITFLLLMLLVYPIIVGSTMNICNAKVILYAREPMMHQLGACIWAIFLINFNLLVFKFDYMIFNIFPVLLLTVSVTITNANYDFHNYVQSMIHEYAQEAYWYNYELKDFVTLHHKRLKEQKRKLILGSILLCFIDSPGVIVALPITIYVIKYNISLYLSFYNEQKLGTI